MENGSGHEMSGVRQGLIGVPLLLCISPLSWAQTPDAGSLLRESQISGQQEAFQQEQGPVVDAGDIRPAIKLPEGATLDVSAFKVTGSSVYDNARLQALVTEWEGKTLDVNGLNDAAGAITRFYQRDGYLLSYAYLPVQKIVDGVVEIAVLEGEIDQIEIVTAADVRLADKVIADHMSGATEKPQVTQNDIERRLLLLNDMPGVVARATFAPGQRPGTSDMVVTVAEEEAFKGRAGINNYGSESTGEYRVWGQFYLNNVFGLGDSTRVYLQAAEKGNLVNSFVQSQVPLGGNGLSLDFGFGHLTYELGGDFTALYAHGEADFANVGLRYALERSATARMDVFAKYEYKDLKDTVVLLAQSGKNSQAIDVGFNVGFRDNWAGAAYTSGQMTYRYGELSFTSQDLVGLNAADIADSYTIMSYDVTRLQQLGAGFSLQLRSFGQFTDDQLDSSERLSLTGPYAVRAYAPSLVSADRAVVNSITLRKNWLMQGKTLSAYLFYDAARGNYQRFADADVGNYISIDGSGVGFNWNNNADFELDLSVAWRGSLEPGTPRQVQDSLSDGTTYLRPQMGIPAGTDREPFVYMQVITGF